MAEIQRHIVKRGERNAISRRYHAKDDKKAITAWRLDLDGVLHVFNVCSITSARRLLTSRFQTELRIDPHPTDSDTHQDTANKHTIVSDAHHDGSNAEFIVPDVRHDVSDVRPIVSRSDVANTRTTASDIHHDKLKSRGNLYGQNKAVSIVHTLKIAKQPLTMA